MGVLTLMTAPAPAKYDQRAEEHCGLSLPVARLHRENSLRGFAAGFKKPAKFTGLP